MLTIPKVLTLLFIAGMYLVSAPVQVASKPLTYEERRKSRIADLTAKASRGDLASMYLLGTDPLVPVKDRDKWFQEGLGRGYGPCLFMHALMFPLSGYKVTSAPGKLILSPRTREEQKQAEEERRSLFAQANHALLNEAKSGDVESMFLLGSEGDVLDKQEPAGKERRLEWLRRAAYRRHEGAIRTLSRFLLNEPTPEAKMEGLEWLKKSASLGEDSQMADAVAQLVNIYLTGLPGTTVGPDLTQAKMWIKRGAKMLGLSTKGFCEEYNIRYPE